uniref:Uncharacterized protein n=1 Tax=Bradyrhizobium diazoefficiens TaxID=1355477 RepID=A0A810CZ72_9BRAD|nr:hypothetical protein XF10B_71460 [Bradyrhizobium diazoefficiens]
MAQALHHPQTIVLAALAELAIELGDFLQLPTCELGAFGGHGKLLIKVHEVSAIRRTRLDQRHHPGALEIFTLAWKI